MRRLCSASLILATFLTFVPLFPAFAQDADGDGMPDTYENAYGCLMANTADAGVDYEPDAMIVAARVRMASTVGPFSARGR
jgi:hypothetical protein